MFSDCPYFICYYNTKLNQVINYDQSTDSGLVVEPWTNIFVSSTVLTSGFLLIVTDSFISNQKWEWTSIERGKGGQKIKYNFAQGLIL